ncbi:biotin--[acetyl-CoA-carboxylase] ligase [bacterium]|nr:biotin--[acetyl-CoA-carboxylase] ligase [bacterium]
MSELNDTLNALDLPAWQFHPVAGSTNDLALAWAKAGGADGALVLADAQTAGRGRMDRHWVTRPGVALAMSMIYRPTPEEAANLTRFTPLAALGLVGALAKLGLDARIKWPNDVLLGGKKVAGVLVEADWQAGRLDSLVVGMGVNVLAEAVPPAQAVRYPGTAIEIELEREVDRWTILAEILHNMKYYRTILTDDRFMAEWNRHLAYIGEYIRFRFPDGRLETAEVVQVNPDGRLALRTAGNQIFYAVAGEIEWLGRAD